MKVLSKSISPRDLDRPTKPLLLQSLSLTYQFSQFQAKTFRLNFRYIQSIILQTNWDFAQS